MSHFLSNFASKSRENLTPDTKYFDMAAEITSKDDRLKELGSEKNLEAFIKIQSSRSGRHGGYVNI